MTQLTVIHWAIFGVTLGLITLAVRLLLAMSAELRQSKEADHLESRIQSLPRVTTGAVSQPRHVQVIRREQA